MCIYRVCLISFRISSRYKVIFPMEIDTESKASHDAEAVPVTDQPSGDEKSKIANSPKVEKNNTASDSTDTPKETGVKHTDVSDTTDTSNGTGDESRKETNGVSNGNDDWRLY